MSPHVRSTNLSLTRLTRRRLIDGCLMYNLCLREREGERERGKCMCPMAAIGNKHWVLKVSVTMTGEEEDPRGIDGEDAQGFSGFLWFSGDFHLMAAVARTLRALWRRWQRREKKKAASFVASASTMPLDDPWCTVGCSLSRHDCCDVCQCLNDMCVACYYHLYVSLSISFICYRDVYQ